MVWNALSEETAPSSLGLGFFWMGRSLETVGAAASIIPKCNCDSGKLRARPAPPSFVCSSRINPQRLETHPCLDLSHSRPQIDSRNETLRDNSIVLALIAIVGGIYSDAVLMSGRAPHADPDPATLAVAHAVKSRPESRPRGLGNRRKSADRA